MALEILISLCPASRYLSYSPLALKTSSQSLHIYLFIGVHYHFAYGNEALPPESSLEAAPLSCFIKIGRINSHIF